MNIFKGQIRKEIIENSLATIHKMKDRMNEVSWNCDIRTSYNLTDNILNIQEFWPLKFSILESVHLYMLNNKKFFDAWKKGLKSLYYCRSKSIQRAENINNAKSTDVTANVYKSKNQQTNDQPEYEECLSCQ